jgi:RES domain-containing protein
VITAWRLVKAKYASHAFDGEGARLYGGRWNSPGIAVTYCSATASLAVLEVFANVQRADLLSRYVLMSCSFDEGLVETVDVAALPANWRHSPSPPELTSIGDDWVRSSRSPVLSVPSAIIEHERNYLINAAHPGFRRIKRSPPEPFSLDLRLLMKS